MRHKGFLFALWSHVRCTVAFQVRKCNLKPIKKRWQVNLGLTSFKCVFNIVDFDLRSWNPKYTLLLQTCEHKEPCWGGMERTDSHADKNSPAALLFSLPAHLDLTKWDFPELFLIHILVKANYIKHKVLNVIPTLKYNIHCSVLLYVLSRLELCTKSMLFMEISVLLFKNCCK